MLYYKTIMGVLWSAFQNVSTLTVTPNIYEPNLIFVGGLASECTADQLRESFTKFGPVEDVSIIEDETKEKRKPYAFVTFESPLSVQNALAFASTPNESNSLYTHVKRKYYVDPSKRQRSNQSRQTLQNEYENIVKICNASNLILLVQSTHIDRLKGYIDVKRKESPEGMFRVEGWTKAVTQNNSLLFMSAYNPIDIAEKMVGDPILTRAMKKAFVVENGAVKANLKNANDCQKVVKSITEIVKENGIKSRFRLQVFPPSYQTQILSHLDMMNDESIILNPRQFSNVISVLEVYTYKGRKKGEEHDEYSLVMVGISPTYMASTPLNTVNDTVSRAYFKLKEAMQAYPVDFRKFRGCVAIDCGSAPGGWTKFLATEIKCSQVYSVDPGELQVHFDNVQHLQMKIQDAIPFLKQEGLPKIKVWVSDMCLHDTEAQVDFLLLAKQAGILEENAFFVLTLKCNIGFSKDIFDRKAEAIIKSLQLKAQTRMISMHHLFSNRSGERTIMGYLL